MDSVFYKEWFQGFSEGLETLDDNSRQSLLRCCAKKCADTGILESYKNHYIKVQGNRDEFYRRIEELGGARGEVITPGKVYAIIFPQCVCDVGRILRTFKIKKNVEVTDNGKIII